MKEVNATKRFYDQNASFWINNKTNSFYYEKQFTKLLSLWPQTASILDIGCAAGIHVPLFLGLGQNLAYTGLDISNSFLKVARRRYPDLDFKKGNIADRKTLPNGPFDGFLASAILMHVPFSHWDMIFSNIVAIMRPGAVGFITLPTEHPKNPEDETDTRHFTILTPEEQKQYFRSKNWQIVSSGTCDGFTKKAIWRWYIVRLP